MHLQEGALPTEEPFTKRVRMLDGTLTKTTEKATLLLTQLCDEARQCAVLPDLQNNSIISVGKLADAGYYTIFMLGGEGVQVLDANESKVTITWDVVLRG